MITIYTTTKDSSARTQIMVTQNITLPYTSVPPEFIAHIIATSTSATYDVVLTQNVPVLSTKSSPQILITPSITISDTADLSEIVLTPNITTPTTSAPNEVTLASQHRLLTHRLKSR